jgi:hypothetical protein
MPRSMLDALTDEEKRGTLANPGSASPLGPTMPMRIGATLNPMLERVQDIFPADNPYGSFIERLIVGDSPERTGRMAEGIPHQYTGAGPNDPIIRPQILDLAGALPIGSAATLAKAAVPFVKAAAVPAAMATGAAALNRLKAPGYAATSMDDIGAALLGQRLQHTGALDDAMVAYQGSPHKFDALDPTKIGTGEGAQVFGHGMYVAENPEVAGGYRTVNYDSARMQPYYDEVMPRKLTTKERAEITKAALGGDKPGEAGLRMHYRAASMRDIPESILDDAIMQNRELSRGYLYEIDVPDEDIAKMLDWDAPLSKQPESVKRVILDSPAAKQFEKQMNDAREAFGVDAAPDWMDDYTGQSFYKQLVELEGDKIAGVLQPGTTRHTAVRPAQVASKYLDELGIPGIKYYDQGSRGPIKKHQWGKIAKTMLGKNTRNMVLFDELARRAKVLKRNDEAIAEPSVDEFIGKLLED